MAPASLLPDRHPNADFFIADIFDSLPVKSDRHTMEHPFFALSTKPDFRTVKYSKDGVSIKLTPHKDLGLPTMMDKDILLYIGSLLMAEINKGSIPPKTLRFSAHDLMVTTNRHTNDVGYKMLKKAFERITGCLITTDIQTDTVKQFGGFHILESFRIVKNSHDKKRMVRMEATVSDWFYNALLSKEVLTINRDYFRLRKSLERRLYELARKHCGRQPTWSINLENLKDKCGALSPLKKFRYQIRQIAKTNHLPDYTIGVSDKDIVTFNRRRPALVKLADIPEIKPETIAKGRRIVDQTGTGWDYNAIREQFTQSLISGDFKPDSVDGAFINFVKMKAASPP